MWLDDRPLTPACSQGVTHHTFHSNGRIRCSLRKGSSGPRFVEWSLSFDLFSPLPSFPLSFRVLDPWSTFFHFLTCFFLTAASTVSYIRRLLLSCATSPIYLPLCCSVYICRSIARIRLFIGYGTSSLLSIHVSNLVLRCRAAPLHQNADKVMSSLLSDIAYIVLFPRSQLVPDRSLPLEEGRNTPASNRSRRPGSV